MIKQQQQTLLVPKCTFWYSKLEIKWLVDNIGCFCYAVSTKTYPLVFIVVLIEIASLQTTLPNLLNTDLYYVYLSYVVTIHMLRYPITGTPTTALSKTVL